MGIEKIYCWSWIMASKGLQRRGKKKQLPFFLLPPCGDELFRAQCARNGNKKTKDGGIKALSVDTDETVFKLFTFTF